jgi:hypothetical protein
METLSSEIVGLIYELLPGFISAWIFFGLTAYLRPSPFERVVQALIFTVIVRAFVIGLREALFFGARFVVIGTWSTESELLWSVTTAVLFGLFLSWCVNNDFPCLLLRKDGQEKCNGVLLHIHKVASRLNLTNKTLHPSEWFSFFVNQEGYVVLHLTGERRLYGWVIQFPDDPDSGHFILDEPEWLLDDGQRVKLHSVDKFCLNVKDVEWVEFLKNTDKITIPEEKQQEDYKPIYKLYERKEIHNANECSEEPAAQPGKVD